MSILNKFIVPGIGLILTLLTGIILERSGKSLTGLLFNVHKLIALAAVVLTIIQLVKIFKTHQPQSLLILLLVVCALCVLALFASGGLMSAGKLDLHSMQIVHRITSLVFVLGAGGVFYLLGWR